MTAAVPDPHHRDQLAEVVDAHGISRRWPGGVDCRCGWFGREAAHAAHVARSLLPRVEARVQAAANQRAAEELEAEAAYDDQAPDEQYARGLFARRLRVRAKNLRAE